VHEHIYALRADVDSLVKPQKLTKGGDMTVTSDYSTGGGDEPHSDLDARFVEQLTSFTTSIIQQQQMEEQNVDPMHTRRVHQSIDPLTGESIAGGRAPISHDPPPATVTVCLFCFSMYVKFIVCRISCVTQISTTAMTKMMRREGGSELHAFFNRFMLQAPFFQRRCRSAVEWWPRWTQTQAFSIKVLFCANFCCGHALSSQVSRSWLIQAQTISIARTS
jgi:hypothetical protein